mmetsp:Transcript_51132/g.135080  ORF Transcript_51132/g.135080 Transcript_51132/m.135080 type:complete len:305 (+) Transcript_51132:372-1286(+)
MRARFPFRLSPFLPSSESWDCVSDSPVTGLAIGAPPAFGAACRTITMRSPTSWSSSDPSVSSSFFCFFFSFSFFSFFAFLSARSFLSSRSLLTFASASASPPDRRFAARRASAGASSARLVRLRSGKTADGRFPRDPPAGALTPAAVSATRNRSRPSPTSDSHAASSSAFAAGASPGTSSTTMPAAARRLRSTRTSSSADEAFWRSWSRSTSICLLSRSASWRADVWAFCASRKAELVFRRSSSAFSLPLLASSASPRRAPSCDCADSAAFCASSSLGRRPPTSSESEALAFLAASSSDLAAAS